MALLVVVFKPFGRFSISLFTSIFDFASEEHMDQLLDSERMWLVDVSYGGEKDRTVDSFSGEIVSQPWARRTIKMGVPMSSDAESIITQTMEASPTA